MCARSLSMCVRVRMQGQSRKWNRLPRWRGLQRWATPQQVWRATWCRRAWGPGRIWPSRWRRGFRGRRPWIRAAERERRFRGWVPRRPQARKLRVRREGRQTATVLDDAARTGRYDAAWIGRGMLLYMMLPSVLGACAYMFAWACKLRVWFGSVP